MNAWIVYEQDYFQDCGLNNVVAIFSTKKKAEGFCRNDGFRYESYQYAFCNEALQKYRKIVGFKMNSTEQIG